MTGVSRSGDGAGLDHPGCEAVSGDATDADDVARLVDGHDAVASALGPSSDEDVDVLSEMAAALVDGIRRTDVSRLVWTGGAGGLLVGPDTMLLETDEFPEEFGPLAAAHVDALEVIRGADDVEWSYLAPAAVIEPGERTGDYRTAEGYLVADDEGESYVSMEDFAVAFVDEVERGDAIHAQVGVGY